MAHTVASEVQHYFNLAASHAAEATALALENPSDLVEVRLHKDLAHKCFALAAQMGAKEREQLGVV